MALPLQTNLFVEMGLDPDQNDNEQNGNQQAQAAESQEQRGAARFGAAPVVRRPGRRRLPLSFGDSCQEGTVEDPQGFHDDFGAVVKGADAVDSPVVANGLGDDGQFIDVVRQMGRRNGLLHDPGLKQSLGKAVGEVRLVAGVAAELGVQMVGDLQDSGIRASRRAGRGGSTSGRTDSHVGARK